LKEPLLRNTSNEPAADRFELPSWWPAETDRGMNRSWWITIMIPPFAGVIILLASGERFWALLPLAVGIALVMTYRRGMAAERLLDEVERKLELDDAAAHDREERDQYPETLSVLDADEDPNR
jgi:hypothetical protein